MNAFNFVSPVPVHGARAAATHRAERCGLPSSSSPPSLSSSSFTPGTSRLHMPSILGAVARGITTTTSPLFRVRMAVTTPAPPPNSLTVLLLGGGGREHALAHSISSSPLLNTLYAYPGNPGIFTCPSTHPLPSSTSPLPSSVNDIAGVLAACRALSVDLVIIGPEEPLVKGMATVLREKGFAVFGPSYEAAQLEGSKVFSKCFLERHEVRTADFAAFQDVSYAQAYARELGLPLVVKAAGLAAGKGVILVHEDEREGIDAAMKAIDDVLVHRTFGKAGEEVVIERLVKGQEISFFALVEHVPENSERQPVIVPLRSAQDHKKVGERDTGPNTGGMGAFSPAPLCSDADDEAVAAIMNDVVKPTVAGMRKEGYPFSGVLYCGLIQSDEDKRTYVLEFNVRFGDPECQCILARMRSDALDLLHRAATGTMQGFDVEWDDDEASAALVVVMATNGYPASYESGSLIKGVEKADAIQGVKVFHAGTKLKENGELVADGGRVLGVTAVGKSIEEAQKRAYQGVDAIEWNGGFCRRDIGWRAIEQQQQQQKEQQVEQVEEAVVKQE